MSNLEAILAKANDSQPAALKRLFELLRIESISTDSAYAVECVNAADWLVAQLNDIGFTASRRDTDGHPMVVAHSPVATGGTCCSMAITTYSRLTR